MSSKKREVKLNKEQEQFIFEKVIGNVDKNELYRYRLDLADMQQILDTNGHEIPDTNDYDTLRKKRKHSIERFSEAKNRIEQFFQYKTEKEIKKVMGVENTQDEISTVETQKRGRKKQYEDREKLTLYISKELANDIECISRVKNISKSNYAVSILEEEINKKKSTLEKLLELQQEL